MIFLSTIFLFSDPKMDCSKGLKVSPSDSGEGIEQQPSFRSPQSLPTASPAPKQILALREARLTREKGPAQEAATSATSSKDYEG